jgi:excisionase family DNA binding protein
MENQQQGIMIISHEEFDQLKTNQLKILHLIENNLKFESMNSTKKSTRGYISVQEFCDALSISRCTFDTLREEGQIKVFQKRRRIYIPEEEVERYIKSH